ncbi:MAG: hypothetical protein ABFD92_20605 [Planctomycetaceae bacterium]|nr:hypothetical protein [Planctomycetaceae bacterium]
MEKRSLFILTMAACLCATAAADAPDTQPATTAVRAATTQAATSAAATSASQPQWTEQAKRQAYLDARTRAFVDLAAQVRFLSVTPKVTVKDFLAESTDLETALMIRLPALAKILDEQYQPAKCSLTLVADVPALAEALADICAAAYKGDKVKAGDFKKLAADKKGQILLAAGESAPEAQEAWSPPIEPAPGENEPRLTNAPAQTLAFWQEHCNAWGLRKVEQDAYKDALSRLARRVRGMQISPKVTVADFVAASDDPGVDVSKFLRGSRETARRYRSDALFVESAAQIRLRSVYMSIRSWSRMHNRKAPQAQMDALEERILKGDDEVISATGVAAAAIKHVTNASPEMLKRLSLASMRPAWMGRVERAEGTAAQPSVGDSDESLRKAIQSAARDAGRALVVKVLDLPVGEQTTMRELMGASEPIRAWVAAYPLDARVVEGSQKIGDDGRITLTIEVELGPMWEGLLRYQDTCTIMIK